MQLKALPGTFYRAGRLQPTELSAKAGEHLRLLRAWEALRDNGLRSVECSQVLQVPRATIYRWRSRWRRTRPSGLEDGSRAHLEFPAEPGFPGTPRAAQPGNGQARHPPGPCRLARLHPHGGPHLDQSEGAGTAGGGPPQESLATAKAIQAPLRHP